MAQDNHSNKALDRKLTVTVENIGGIDECEVSFSLGTTILKGRNATNRTSFLTAVSGALGGSTTNLKSDAEKGSVELSINDETYLREYVRNDPTVATTGKPYTDEECIVDLFVSLLGNNPVRQTVEQGGDLRDILMQPVDTTEIESRINELGAERQRLQSRIDEIERERNRLPKLEERRNSLQKDLDSVRSDLEEVNTTVEEYNADEAEAEQAEELLDELEGLRQQRSTTEEQIKRQESEIERLIDERETVEAELESSSEPDGDLDEIETQLDQLRQQKREVENVIDDITRIVSFNEELTNQDDYEGLDLRVDNDVTASLNPQSETVECWTCGSRVERNEIAERLESLRDTVEEKRAEHLEFEEQIKDLEERQAELQQMADEKASLDQQLDELQQEIEHRRGKKASLEDDVADIRDQIDRLQERVEETEELRNSQLVEAYQKLNRLEYKRGKLERELENVESEIEQIEEAEDESEDLEAQIDELMAEIQSLRSRIDDLEEDAIEQFNEHMAEVLSLLEYGNLERVWIERKQPSTGRRDETSNFELHIVRETDTGSVYDDTIENLSESEREVIGLVVALAGYLVHDVHQHVPVMLLDSLEAIDAHRIARLIDYFSEYASYQLVALLPEDEQALADSYERISSNELRP